MSSMFPSPEVLLTVMCVGVLVREPVLSSDPPRVSGTLLLADCGRQHSVDGRGSGGGEERERGGRGEGGVVAGKRGGGGGEAHHYTCTCTGTIIM